MFYKQVFQECFSIIYSIDERSGYKMPSNAEQNNNESSYVDFCHFAHYRFRLLTKDSDKWLHSQTTTSTESWLLSGLAPISRNIARLKLTLRLSVVGVLRPESLKASQQLAAEKYGGP